MYETNSLNGWTEKAADCGNDWYLSDQRQKDYIVHLKKYAQPKILELILFGAKH